MSGKMKANPDSRRIWNLIMGVLRGAWDAAAPIVQEMFCSEYNLWRQHGTVTATEQRPVLLRHSAVIAASSFQTSIPTADYPRIKSPN